MYNIRDGLQEQCDNWNKCAGHAYHMLIILFDIAGAVP